jgi:hypothetical protein
MQYLFFLSAFFFLTASSLHATEPDENQEVAVATCVINKFTSMAKKDKRIRFAAEGITMITGGIALEVYDRLIQDKRLISNGVSEILKTKFLPIKLALYPLLGYAVYQGVNDVMTHTPVHLAEEVSRLMKDTAIYEQVRSECEEI